MCLKAQVLKSVDDVKCTTEPWTARAEPHEAEKHPSNGARKHPGQGCPDGLELMERLRSESPLFGRLRQEDYCEFVDNQSDRESLASKTNKTSRIYRERVLGLP